MNNLFNNKYLTVSLLILIAAVSRFMPHPSNFAPIAAIALFGGAKFANKKLAYLVPFLAMIISDLFLGFYDFGSMFTVYACFALTVFMGSYIANKQSVAKVAGLTLLSSIVFFVFTNLSVWVYFGTYTHDLSGLVACYVAAIPFFRNSVIGDLVFSGALFGIYAVIENKLPNLVKVKA